MYFRKYLYFVILCFLNFNKRKKKKQKCRTNVYELRKIVENNGTRLLEKEHQEFAKNLVSKTVTFIFPHTLRLTFLNRKFWKP